MVLAFGADFVCPAFAGLEPDLFLEGAGFLPTSWVSTSCGIPLSMKDVYKRQLGVVADAAAHLVIGLPLDHDGGPHERQGILQRGTEPALPIAHAPDSTVPQDAVQILSVRVVVDLAGPLIQSDISHSCLLYTSSPS